MWQRRSFLLGGAALGASALWPSRARAAWATGPTTVQPDLLPAGQRAESVLEVFLYGGLSPWESFYVVEDHGRPDDPQFPNQQWHLFADAHDRLYGRACGLGDPATWLQPWRIDANGKQVHLGPTLAPLRERPDILDRMRVIVMAHDLEPHEAAIPYTLSGHRLGNPRMAGMGAHVQRYFSERNASGRTVPYSIVLNNNRIVATDNLIAATAVGMHPGAARPLALTIRDNVNLGELLRRDHLSERERGHVDALLAHHEAKVRARYQTLDGRPLRSPARADHAFALSALALAPDLVDVLGPDLLAGEGSEACAQSGALDVTRVGIRAAAELLRHPTDPVRYVNVIDPGLQLADGGGGYDTHFEHPITQAVNTTSLMRNLADHINAPGENDPKKIDLDQTMVMLTTEFGRTPTIQTDRGTNHHPYGYVCVLIGGPIGPDQAGLVGAIGPSGLATSSITPGELRTAALVAMGMWPFSQESYAVGDLSQVATEHDGLIWCLEHVLGVR